jgi:hypothetical protein
MHSIRAVPRESGNKDPSNRQDPRVFFIACAASCSGALTSRRRPVDPRDASRSRLDPPDAS